jgi:hypothetical protein
MSQDSWEILIRIPKFPEIFRDYICHVRPLNMPLEWHPNYILISKKLWFKSVLRQVIMSHICRRMILNIYHPWGQPCIGHFHSSSKGATMDRSFLFFLQGGQPWVGHFNFSSKDLEPWNPRSLSLNIIQMILPRPQMLSVIRPNQSKDLGLV